MASQMVLLAQVEDLAPMDSVAILEAKVDSMLAGDTTNVPMPDELAPIVMNDTVKIKVKRDWATWKPNPQKALWLALVLPGAGQIYNRKYWKLPIIYGGFVGCFYAMTWNNMMFKDYSQAYMEIEVFKNRKDKYRRWRDLSFFVMIGVYAISVIDAYVDAELSQFDISKDLSLRVTPAVINNHSTSNPLESSSFGVNCSLNF